MSLSSKFFIDIPNPSDLGGSMIPLGEFSSREEAIRWAMKHIGTDDQGNLCVISEVENDNEDSGS